MPQMHVFLKCFHTIISYIWYIISFHTTYHGEIWVGPQTIDLLQWSNSIPEKFLVSFHWAVFISDKQPHWVHVVCYYIILLFLWGSRAVLCYCTWTIMLTYIIKHRLVTSKLTEDVALESVRSFLQWFGWILIWEKIWIETWYKRFTLLIIYQPFHLIVAVHYLN